MPTRATKSTIIIALIAALPLLAAYSALLISTVLTFSENADIASQELIIGPSEAPTITDRLPGTLEAINAYRAAHDLSPLKLSDMLSNSAQAKADDLVQYNYWAHSRDSQSPWDFVTAAGYKYEKAGENLARCFTDESKIVPAWIASPAHEKVLTGDYSEVGFGITHNDIDGCDYVVAHFGTKAVPARTGASV